MHTLESLHEAGAALEKLFLLKTAPLAIRLIGRDDGRPLDLSDADSAPDSFRAYTLSRFTSQKMFSAVHMMAVSFNRNMFVMVLTEKKAHE